MDPLLDRFVQAFNAHDLDAFVGCFAEDYRSEQPAHPRRGFGGRGQVRENWSRVFADVPDARLVVVGSVETPREMWLEMRIQGTRRDGSRMDLRGVAIHGVEGAGIQWARLYLEETETGGADIRETIGRWAHSLRGV